RRPLQPNHFPYTTLFRSDHYLCYKIKATTTFTPITVNLIDQFETTAADVKKPKDLCPPANKNNEGVIDPVTHEESYPIKAAVKRSEEHTSELQSRSDLVC